VKPLGAEHVGEVSGLCEAGTFFWIDLEAPSHEQIEDIGSRLSLHPLAMEDTRDWGQRPKLDVYDDHVFLVFYSAEMRDDAIALIEVHLFISGRWVVTVHRDPCPALESLAADDGRAGSEAETVYRILDALTDAYEPIVGEVEAKVDALELEVFERVRQSQLERIYRLKQDVGGLTRRVSAQRDAFPATSAAVLALPGLEPGGEAYLRDVGDHLALAAGEFQRQAMDLHSLTDTYFNANTNRLNMLATRLSVAATFFLAWTLVTGFFGQNFGWLVRSIDSQRDFVIFGVGLLVVPTIVLAAYFWRRRSDWS
jgi:magnesium transporter